MKLRRIIAAGILLDIAATAVMAKIVVVGSDPCPLPADAEVYVTPAEVLAEDATPRLRVEKSLVVLRDVRLDNDQSIAGRLFARLAIDPETGEIIGAEKSPPECAALP